MARNPRVIERRTQQRAPTARRRTDQIRKRRLCEPGSCTHEASQKRGHRPKVTLSIAIVKNTRNLPWINKPKGRVRLPPVRRRTPQEATPLDAKSMVVYPIVY